MNITFDHIVAIIRKAVQSKYDVECGDVAVYINNQEGPLFLLHCIVKENNKGYIIQLSSKTGSLELEIDNKEYFQLKVIMEEIKQYRKGRAIQEIGEFLAEDSKQPIQSIDELNDED